MFSNYPWWSSTLPVYKMASNCQSLSVNVSPNRANLWLHLLRARQLNTWSILISIKIVHPLTPDARKIWSEDLMYLLRFDVSFTAFVYYSPYKDNPIVLKEIIALRLWTKRPSKQSKRINSWQTFWAFCTTADKMSFIFDIIA